MHMTLVDWVVVAGVLSVFVGTAVMANRLTRRLSDYLVAGGYMLTIAPLDSEKAFLR